jgi:Holliday junction resolvasome RuvABC DNA-binding subunit
MAAHVGVARSTSSNAHETTRAGDKLDAAILRTQAKQALTGLGWKPAIAQTAVAAAVAAQGADATLERLIFEALRRCPNTKT